MSEKKHYGYLWLAELKKLAKTLKKDHPDLNHSQRLELAAQQFAGVRHYHEAMALHKQYIDSLQERKGSSLVNCKYCDLNYYADLAEDLKWHEERHLKYEKAEKALGYKPEAREEREASKQVAYEGMYLQKENPKKQVEYALKLIRAHFDRSLEAAIDGDYWKSHPPFEAFAAMMDYGPSLIPPEAMQVIRNRYGCIEGPIPRGLSYWFPRNQA
ncbi:hypothetical protein [Endozoicomonas euniceicola]|uniref:N-acetyltransferase ESCO zinc-finger domain-containing protein n=1 Tax=Endozoicomonas euniceicola TaxID=1234143 RepID=A0ABY6GTR8_9GAMM|nr:hypothetical protein [Endozoicomonas euniceicola]UYM15491.1 hypothetical protein NX720_21990 [Endozoicomonas euniceicola]